MNTNQQSLKNLSSMDEDEQGPLLSPSITNAHSRRKYPYYTVPMLGFFLVFGRFLFVGLCTVWSSKNFRSFESVYVTSVMSPRPDTQNCTVKWFEQPIDNFNIRANVNGTTTYQQRYFVYDSFWKRKSSENLHDGPIFFYCGNEGDVTLYVNNTGLMWENAERFGALLIFAEHRYYGESQPFGNKSVDHIEFLSHEQALGDYARLIYHFKKDNNAMDSPVIAFGGSYGGMLAAWFRMKYPGTIDGAIAASAPILAFQGEHPEFRGESYWQVVTKNAEICNGGKSKCATNIRRIWPAIFKNSKTAEGRKMLSDTFKLCDQLQSEEQGNQLADFMLVAIDTLAMGNFPYESSYLTGGNGMLPAWPVEAACSHLDREFTDNEEQLLLKAMSDGMAIYNNATKDLQCLTLPELVDFDGVWDYQWCSETLPQETYFNSNGETDMFWERTITLQEIKDRCKRVWGVEPRADWIRTLYGDGGLDGVSNIVFSNGNLDPWSSGGVKKSSSESIRIVTIDNGAHHLDLFFSHPEDPMSVRNARDFEVEQIAKWVTEANRRGREKKRN